MLIASESECRISEIIDRVDMYKAAMSRLSEEYEEPSDSFALLVIGADIAAHLELIGKNLNDIHCRMP